MYLQSFSNTYGLPYILTNCSNNMEKISKQREHPTVFRSTKNKIIPIYGNGLNIRDWIHVDDHSNAILLLLKKEKIIIDIILVQIQN